jgi:biotin operon repressor
MLHINSELDALKESVCELLDNHRRRLLSLEGRVAGLARDTTTLTKFVADLAGEIRELKSNTVPRKYLGECATLRQFREFEERVLKLVEKEQRDSLINQPHQPIKQPLEEVLLRLTPQEKAVLNVVLRSDAPLCYEDIARVLGISPATVRFHARSLESKGFYLQTARTNKFGKRWVEIPKGLRSMILAQ